MFYNSHYNIYPNGLNPTIYYFNPIGDNYLGGGSWSHQYLDF